MYAPDHFRETRTEVMHALIQAHSLGVWVSPGDDALVANHIPFDLDASRGELGVLVGHIARANTIWRQIASGPPALVIFQGPQAYISPSWYPSKHEHGKAVPTWNYAVVHAHGRPTFIQDREWLHRHVSSLTGKHEATRPRPWAVSDALPDYVDKMLSAIVGVEIPISRLEGKWKMSQNRVGSDRAGVVSGLEQAHDLQAAAVALTVKATLGTR